MTDGSELRVSHLTKTFGRRRPVHAVRDLSFSVSPGRVTGFLGPNGSGKTTTLRCLLGLVTPTSGAVTIAGSPYRDLPHPTRTVGAALEASGVHPARTARNHLRILAAAGGIPATRVNEVLVQVGLDDAANRRVGGFSLGMRQRLALAGALLGDPGVLILDEPANGLDPEGIAWLRAFLRDLAAQGRTVLVSSHVLSEVRQTVDDVVVIAGGELVHAGALDSLVSAGEVHVRSPRAAELAAMLADADAVRVDGDSVHVVGLTMDDIGHRAFTAGIELHELSTVASDLEQAFLSLTASGRPGGAL